MEWIKIDKINPKQDQIYMFHSDDYLLPLLAVFDEDFNELFWCESEMKWMEVDDFEATHYCLITKPTDND